MKVAVVSPDDGIRSILMMFLEEEGYKAERFPIIQEKYKDTDLVVFGPGFSVPHKHIEMLDQEGIFHMQLAHFEDMEVFLEQVNGYYHQLQQRADQCIEEDRAV